jgi:hypothetical protein
MGACSNFEALVLCSIASTFTVLLLLIFCWLQGGQNLLAGHTQQPTEPAAVSADVATAGL